MKDIKLFYWPDLDGLRALSVLGVIFFHLQIQICEFAFFKGEFLGVNIFFLISGFLMSSLLIKEYFTKKNICLKNFYERRARRILPAPLLVLCFS